MRINKLSIILVTVSFAIGLGVGYNFISKDTESEKIQENSDVTTIIKERVEPDGTTTRTTKIKDKSTKTKETETTKVVTRTQYKVQVMYGLDLNTKIPVYGVGVERRILGNISAGVWGLTNKTVGASLSYEF